MIIGSPAPARTAELGLRGAVITAGVCLRAPGRGTFSGAGQPAQRPKRPACTRFGTNFSAEPMLAVS